MTIAAEQAQVLKAGITPGRWKAADAKGTFGILCYEDIRNDTGVSVASVWHSDDYAPLPADDYAPLPDRKTRAGNASAIAAIPDMLDTIIAQAAEIDRLTYKLDDAVSVMRCPEVMALAEALHYYADFHENPNDGPWGLASDDYGKVAREALIKLCNKNGRSK